MELTTLHHYISPPQLDVWLHQFERLRAGWIGAALMRLLDFWPDCKISEALFEPKLPHQRDDGDDLLKTYDLILYNDPSRGKSAAVVARYVKTKWGIQDKVKSLPEALSTPGTNRKILFLEDCIMTGTECIALLKDPQMKTMLSGDEIDFKFAIGTQYGISRVEAFLSRSGLERVSIIKPRMGLIDNLTREAVNASFRGSIFNANDELVDAERYLIDGITLRGCKLINATKRSHVMHFCRLVGKQLMLSNYIRGGHDAAVANELAAQHALGFGNMGLLLAFAHGLPDNILPLFRLAGTVSHDGHCVDWVPLFQPVGSKT